MYNEKNVLMKARQLNRIVNNRSCFDKVCLDNIGENPYDGSFKTLYYLVDWNQIKLLTHNGVVCGISVDACKNTIEEDNIAAYQFQQAYSPYKVERYIQTIAALKAAGLRPDLFEEEDGNVFIYLYRQGKVLDADGDVIVELTNDEIENVTMENIYEVLRRKVEESFEEEVEEHDNDEEYYDENDSYLPNQIGIDAEEAEYYGLTLESPLCAFKRYLRLLYHHFTAKGSRFTVEEGPDNAIILKNVEWGRELTEREYDYEEDVERDRVRCLNK